MVAESWLWDVDVGKWEQGTVTLAAFRRPSCHPGQSPLYSVGGIRVSTQGDRSFGGRRHSWRGRDEGGWGRGVTAASVSVGLRWRQSADDSRREHLQCRRAA